MEAIYDQQWHRAALQGDKAAIGRLAREALTPLYRFCHYRVGRRRHLCEEVVQETLLRAIRQLDSYQPERAGGDIFPWLSGLARNEIARSLRQEDNSEGLLRLWQRMDEDLRRLYASMEAEPYSDAVLAREETGVLVNATLSQMPPKYRRALEEKYLAGRSVREIASLFATTEKAIESQLSRARKAFRETFEALVRNLEFEAAD